MSGLVDPALVGVDGREAASRRVIVAGSQVIEAQIGIVLLPGVAEAVRGVSFAVLQAAEGLVDEVIGFDTGLVAQVADAAQAVAVVGVRAACPGLADALLADDVGGRWVVAVIQFFQQLFFSLFFFPSQIGWCR